MGSANMSSILSKVNSYMSSDEGRARAAEVIDGYVTKGVRTTGAGSKVLTLAEMSELADKLCKQVAACANGRVADSVGDAVGSLTASAPVKTGELTYTIDLSFTGNLERESLQPKKYESIHNIVALMNNGYNAPNAEYVRGYWHGVYTHGLASRPAIGFMQTAVNDFNSTYGHLGVHAELSSEYT